jgi:hypothetical protein
LGTSPRLCRLAGNQKLKAIPDQTGYGTAPSGAEPNFRKYKQTSMRLPFLRAGLLTAIVWGFAFVCEWPGEAIDAPQVAPLNLAVVSPNSEPPTPVSATPAAPTPTPTPTPPTPTPTPTVVLRPFSQLAVATIRSGEYSATDSITDSNNVRVYRSFIVNATLPRGMQQVPTALCTVVATNGSGTYFSYHFTLVKLGNTDSYEAQLDTNFVVTPGMTLQLELDRTVGAPPSIIPVESAVGKFYVSGDIVSE